MSRLLQSVEITALARTRRSQTGLFILVAALICAAGFFVSPGLFTIDEVLYSAASHAFLANGHFIIENGWLEFHSDDLRLSLLVDGSNGLVPQYPAGHAVLGAFFLWLFGERGLMMMNVLAGPAMIFALRALAERLFQDKTAALVAVALLLAATFWLEYVYAVWPHSVAMLGVTLALICILDCVDAEQGFAVKAIAAGGAVGLGFLMRTDTILALPAIGLIVWLFARRPFSILLLAGLGFLPFASFTSAANFVKFGTFNPLTYGQTDGGGTSLTSHIVPIAVLAMISLVIFLSRFIAWRPGKRDYAIGLAVAALALLLSHTARGFVQDYLSGAWALVFDATTIPDRRSGMTEMPGGLLLFWGHWKKALGQSMPWLGLLFLAVHQPADKHVRRSQMIVLILAAIWTLPFFVRTWHGGLGNDMRYFLPIVPPLCVWGGKLLVDFARTVPRARTIMAIGLAIGFWILISWNRFHVSHLGGAQQILSTYMLLTICSFALFAGIRWAGQETVRILCLASIGSGLAASTFFSTMDFATAQSDRTVNRLYSAALHHLPDQALVYAPPRYMVSWSFRPGHITALPKSRGNDYDYSLIDAALNKGYRVIIWRGITNDGLRDRYAARLKETNYQFVGMREIVSATD